MIVGSLCSGVGGLDLGLERAGCRVAWQAERIARSIVRSRDRAAASVI